MATLSAFSSLCSICRVDGDSTHSSSSSSLSLRSLLFSRLQSHVGVANYRPKSSLPVKRLRELRSVAEEEALIPEAEAEAEAEQAEEPASTTAAEVPVSVQVSPSDVLTMFFQAEGTMNETAIPTVTKALEEKEGITNINVQVLEGIATVETTVQATGVASSLVETIQGSGFKLQTLNLSFEDEEDIN